MSQSKTVQEVRDLVIEDYNTLGKVKLLPMHNLYHLPLEHNIYKARRLLDANYILYYWKDDVVDLMKLIVESKSQEERGNYCKSIAIVRKLGIHILDELENSIHSPLDIFDKDLPND